MFCCKKDYLKIEKFQCNALKVIYNSSESYEELLTLSNEVPIHQKHVRALATEIYKSSSDINPDFMKPYFIIKEMIFNLRNGCALKLPPANSTYYGINSFTCSFQSMFIVESATTFRKAKSVTT